jgi:hypothetical protein
MTKRKINKNIQNNLIEHKEVTTMEPTFFGSWRMIPMTARGIEGFIQELYTWAYRNNEAIHLSQFLRMKGLSRKMFLEWCKKFERLADAYEDVKFMLAGRVLEGALKKEYCTSMAQYILPKMHSEFDEATRYHASLKKPDDKAVTIDVIKVPVFVDRDNQP